MTDMNRSGLDVTGLLGTLVGNTGNYLQKHFAHNYRPLDWSFRHIQRMEIRYLGDPSSYLSRTLTGI
jgi:hypothetical protein